MKECRAHTQKYNISFLLCVDFECFHVPFCKALLKNAATVCKEDLKLAKQNVLETEEKKFSKTELNKTKRILELIKST